MSDNPLQDMVDGMLGMTKPMTKYLELNGNGRPRKHWSGRVQAAKVLRQFINVVTPAHISTEEAEDITEDMLRAYLQEQK